MPATVTNLTEEYVAVSTVSYTFAPRESVYFELEDATALVNDPVISALIADGTISVEDAAPTTWPGSDSTPLFTIDSHNDQVATGGSTETGYRSALRSATDQSGLFVKSAGDTGTTPLHVENSAGTQQVLHALPSGAIGVGGTTPTYGVDNLHASGNVADFNTTGGVYRIGGNRANDVVTAYDSTGGLSLTGTPAQVVLDATTVIGSIYALDGGSIIISEKGRYLIALEMSAQVVGTTRTNTSAELYLNSGAGIAGFAAVTGTICYGYQRTTATPYGTAATTVALDLNTGNKLALYATRVGTTVAVNTTSNASRLTVMRLT